MINISNVSCGYDNHPVIKDISFDVENGQRICIVGPNGCGKSTLLKSIVGLIKYNGEIKIDDMDLHQMKRKEIANKIAFMSQISSVYFSYTVFEAVMLGRYAKINGSVFSSPSQSDIDYVNQCIQTVDLFHLKDRCITDLSGGELQRVFLARAFAQEPQIILLDEPTNHLDLKHQIELIKHLKKWSENSDKIVIAVLHDINLALWFSDKILLLSNGEKIAYDTKDAILKSNELNQIYGLDVKEYMLNSYKQWNV